MERFGLLARTVGVIAAAAVLGACQSSVETAVHVREGGGADVEILVSFEGDIEDLLTKDEALREEMETVIKSRVKNFEVLKPGSSYVIRPSIEELRSSAGLTGVSDVSTGGEGSTVQVAVSTVYPQDLAESIKKAVESEPDAGALYDTMAANTFLEVSVEFPGSVLSANGGVTSGSKTTYRDSIQNWATGTLVVEGSTSRPRPWMQYVAVVVVAAGAAFWWRRRGK